MIEPTDRTFWQTVFLYSDAICLMMALLLSYLSWPRSADSEKRRVAWTLTIANGSMFIIFVGLSLIDFGVLAQVDALDVFRRFPMPGLMLRVPLLVCGFVIVWRVLK